MECAVRVSVRIRPLVSWEKIGSEEDSVPVYWKADRHTVFQTDGSKSFNFDRVFHSEETTRKVYQELALPIVHSAIHGYNGTIFAYGQTSSGKTYTMMGTEVSLGVIPQAIHDVFKIISQITNREFLLRVSYMEIYNETATDLICESRKRKPLEVREDINGTIYVSDLTEEVVTEEDQVMQWIKKGEKNRHYGETKMNEHSSRSHTIFRMIIESRDRSELNAENCDGVIMVSHLNLVDLAGSERASQTGAKGVRLKEGCNINRSLFVLGQVIKKLSDQQAGGFINYRDSKLTRILQNSLGGNAKTVIICTITPVTLEETLSTLQFASTAKFMKNTPQVNEVLNDEALLKRYRKEILDLKFYLEEVTLQTRAHAMEKQELAQLLAEKEELQKENDDRIINLTKMIITSGTVLQRDHKVKIKRRETWAPGKLCTSLYEMSAASFTKDFFETGPPAVKYPRMCDFSMLKETDEVGVQALNETAPEVDGNQFFHGGRSLTNRFSATEDFAPDGFASNSFVDQEKTLHLQKEMELKIAELEQQLQGVLKEKWEESEQRKILERRILELEQKQQVNISDTEKEESKEILAESALEWQLLPSQNGNSSEEHMETQDGNWTDPLQVIVEEEELENEREDARTVVAELEEKLQHQSEPAKRLEEEALQGKIAELEQQLDLQHKGFIAEKEEMLQKIASLEADGNSRSLHEEKILLEEKIQDLETQLATLTKERNEKHESLQV
nr:PREDICTED: centromere-associated protein E-like [Latimeria chalumnae]|eukprot:XP_014350548.1 PREDICTED: centromere-associated protein E-like [Latimeria chalumnae]